MLGRLGHLSSQCYERVKVEMVLPEKLQVSAGIFRDFAAAENVSDSE